MILNKNKNKRKNVLEKNKGTSMYIVELEITFTNGTTKNVFVTLKSSDTLITP